MKLDVLKSLNSEERSLLKKEYSFIRQNLPRRVKWSKEINKIIIESVAERVKNNSGYYFNNVFINFIEDVLKKDNKKDDLFAYETAFTYTSLAEQYCLLVVFFDYYMNINEDDYIICELECDSDILSFSLYELSEKFKTYKEFSKFVPTYQNYRELYVKILLTMAVYFIINNDLFHNDKLYGDICDYLFHNQDCLLDYYKMNYDIDPDAPYSKQVDMLINIVNDLVNKYHIQMEQTDDTSKIIY